MNPLSFGSMSFGIWWLFLIFTVLAFVAAYKITERAAGSWGDALVRERVQQRRVTVPPPEGQPWQVSPHLLTPPENQQKAESPWPLPLLFGTVFLAAEVCLLIPLVILANTVIV
jgi:hypothetical protein